MYDPGYLKPLKVLVLLKRPPLPTISKTIVSITTTSDSGVSRISFRGRVEVLINFRKVEALGGFGGMRPPRKFLKIMQFGTFWRIFCYNFIPPKNCKNVYILYKNLRYCITLIFRGIGAYYPDCFATFFSRGSVNHVGAILLLFLHVGAFLVHMGSHV